MVKGPRQLIHAKELIELYMLENQVSKIDNYEAKDYTLENKQMDELIKSKFIKVQNAEFIEKVK